MPQTSTSFPFLRAQSFRDFPGLFSGGAYAKTLMLAETVREDGASDTLVKEPNRPFPSSIKGNHFMQNRFAVS
jgi:hypothetical protein